MSWEILELLGSVMTLLFAITFAYAGVELFLAGRSFVGAGLLGVAVGTMLMDRYVTTVGDLPGLVASKLLEEVVDPPDKE
jgi:nucleoside recognition membrane protein YjiH